MITPAKYAARYRPVQVPDDGSRLRVDVRRYHRGDPTPDQQRLWAALGDHRVSWPALWTSPTSATSVGRHGWRDHSAGVWPPSALAMGHGTESRALTPKSDWHRERRRRCRLTGLRPR